MPCENCHSAAGWRPIRAVPEFDHNKTRYPLRGMHEKVDCVQCHVKPVFTDVGKNCADCHQDVHRRQMGPNCEQCHTVQGWDIAVQQVKDHMNRFPLLGAHAAVQCEECHKQAATGIFYGLSTQCDSCHLKDWQQTTNPPHASAGTAFAAANCQGCHTTFDSWLGVKFDHSTTGFPLTNAHASPPLPCSACHVNNNYNLQIQPTDCGNSSCHLTQWNSTQTMGGNVPNHVTAGFPIAQCSTCHDTISWADATFNHATTGFPLTNAHASPPLQCAQCHINNNYSLKIAPTDCGNPSCHLTTWQQTNNPTHSTAGSAFAAANCSQCHDTIAWTDLGSFNHSLTGFALVGTHSSPNPTPCVSCHVNNNYTLSSTDCMSCHQSSWNSTQTLGGSVPNHVAANFPSTASACASCHPITTWAAGQFDHSTTGFPLQNSHQMAPAGKVTACTQCHVGGNYNLNILPTDCGNSQCHLTTWQQTNNPTHSAVGSAFAAANCSTCHDTTVWTNSTFNHAVTGWPLTGNHQMAPAGAITACTQCHVGNNYNLTSTDCFGCHTMDWNSTQTLGGAVPNHVAANFPTSLCSTCHDTLLWADGKFDHSTTGWALTGAHQMSPAGKVTACSQCHVSNNYSLTSANTACYGCHVADWNSTQTLGGSVPNHIAAGYPTTCDTCHTTTSWLGATFNHTYFPIPHHGSVCNDCHQVSTDYSSFTCINCHTTTAHQQTQTVNTHAGVSGFVYGPETCYNCHKNGGGG